MRVQHKINPRLSQEILELLLTRGWTAARLARTIHVGRAFINGVASADESFTPQHVRTLAKSARTDVRRLFFDAMEPAALKSKDRGMWLSLRRVLDSSEAFEATLRATPKPAKKRRARVKAA
jgi:hypothetical protein